MLTVQEVLKKYLEKLAKILFFEENRLEKQKMFFPPCCKIFMNINEQILSLKNTLTSGQCFRTEQKNEIWSIKAGIDENVKVLKISQAEIEILQNNSFWYNYFDLQTDYEKIKNSFFEVSDVMKKACAFAPGIRILRQDGWEALASFVVSQNNNIKRIAKIIEKMCETFGKRNECGVYGFPSATTLASAPLDKLRSTGLGFRDTYIKNTATSVLDGKIDFQVLQTGNTELARKMLMSVKGIGTKVADCTLLFGFHRLDCCPVDVWMKRVLSLYFDNKDLSIFGENKGVAQQYLFHWIRMNAHNKMNI